MNRILYATIATFALSVPAQAHGVWHLDNAGNFLAEYVQPIDCAIAAQELGNGFCVIVGEPDAIFGHWQAVRDGQIFDWGLTAEDCIFITDMNPGSYCENM